MHAILPDIIPSKKCKQLKIPKQVLRRFQDENSQIHEIGVDEVGRGPLFGRVYTAAVILPKDDSFDHYKMKDSKKFTSTNEIEIVSEYIKKNALAWEELNHILTEFKNMESLYGTEKVLEFVKKLI